MEEDLVSWKVSIGNLPALKRKKLIEELRGGWSDGRMDGWKDGWKEGWKEGWKDQKMDE